MKKNFRPLIKGTNWALAGLLTWMGFPGCSLIEPMEEYGTPYASYTFRGTVSNEAGEPLPDIKIEVATEYDHVQNPAISNTAGHYAALLRAFPSKEFQLIATDIDGEKNGAYENDTISITINDSDYFNKGDGKWNRGEAQKDVNIVLKEKK
jgi:putative lipoprotein (rSAM/lipoprotein system)